MAQAGSQTDLVQQISSEDMLIAEKKLATDNVNWKPIGLDDEDHGAGYIPEELWKEKYSPDSQERTAL